MPQLRAWKVFKKRKVLWENKLEERENGILEFDRRRTELHIETQRICDGPNLAAYFFHLDWCGRHRQQSFFAGKTYLKINSLVKTPLHDFMSVARSRLQAPGLTYRHRYTNIGNCLLILL